MMHAEDRERTILSMLASRGFVSFRELDQHLGASPATVRRDLERLATAGRIVRVHGGAKIAEAPAALAGVPFHDNVIKHTAAKKAIGKAAAALCAPGESIIIDGGSTTLQMCPHLAGLSLQVFTNSLHIVAALMPQDTTRVSLPAGTLFREQNIVLSAFDDDGSGHFAASKMFLGAAGVSSDGLLQTDVILLQAERRLMARTSKIILLVDSSKFAQSRGAAVCGLDAIDTLITDTGISDEAANLIRGAGATLVTVTADAAER